MQFKDKLTAIFTHFVLICVYYPVSAVAEEDDSFLSVSVGAASTLSYLYIYERAAINKNETAKLKSETNTPTIRLSTKNLAGSGSNLLVTINAAYSQFSTNLQEFKGKEYNYGTSADVKYVYVNGEIGYHSGGAESSVAANRTGFFASVGYGIVQLNAKGNYVDTRSGDSASQKTRFSVSSMGDLLEIYFGYQVRAFKFGFRGVSGDFEEINTNDDNAYRFVDGLLEVTYSFFF